MKLNGYSVDETEDMVPFERDVHLGLTLKYLEDKAKRSRGE